MTMSKNTVPTTIVEKIIRLYVAKEVLNRPARSGTPTEAIKRIDKDINALKRDHGLWPYHICITPRWSKTLVNGTTEGDPQ